MSSSVGGVFLPIKAFGISTLAFFLDPAKSLRRVRPRWNRDLSHWPTHLFHVEHGTVGLAILRNLPSRTFHVEQRLPRCRPCLLCYYESGILPRMEREIPPDVVEVFHHIGLFVSLLQHSSRFRETIGQQWLASVLSVAVRHLSTSPARFPQVKAAHKDRPCLYSGLPWERSSGS